MSGTGYNFRLLLKWFRLIFVHLWVSSRALVESICQRLMEKNEQVTLLSAGKPAF